jgi:hypothetical protein
MDFLRSHQRSKHRLAQTEQEKKGRAENSFGFQGPRGIEEKILLAKKKSFRGRTLSVLPRS